MAVTKIADLVGQIDCPECFSLLQWDSKEDVKGSSIGQYIICPECGQHVHLEPGKDYWVEASTT